MLSDMIGDKKPSDMEINQFPMWVRVYNLPFKGRLNKDNVQVIGNKIGNFTRMDSSGTVGIDKSIRLRVMIDARKPLIKKIKIKMRGGKEVFFKIKYEKPPIFFFIVERLGMD